ncbi:GNAT family N-acetyltransferase [Pelagicoccus albus]|uniref:GNAT family N-acetyltransferase n=1 Tax=Pelagicoccus albus TaxID=415222 RepID=A0A7X1E9S4_9BACT|nr:GNAT family N-acetyltransferase [Pelagicoccus albus]MBC2606067.1 GNAT family N-acetyltransferase [Pelagicoccus albus]
MSKLSKLRLLLEVSYARLEDIPDILSLHEVSFSKDALELRRSELEKIIGSSDSKILVCRIRDSFAGYMIMVEPRFRPWTNGEYLAVRRGHAGKGAAAILMEEGMRLAKRPFVRILVRPSNVSALKLYRRYGFVKAGCKRGFYADGEDAIVLLRATFWVRSRFR